MKQGENTEYLDNKRVELDHLGYSIYCELNFGPEPCHSVAQIYYKALFCVNFFLQNICLIHHFSVTISFTALSSCPLCLVGPTPGFLQPR